MPKTCFTLLIFCCILSLSAFSQRRHVFHMGTGTVYYSGDLSDGPANTLFRPALFLGYQFYYTPFLSSRASFSFGQMGASDALSTVEGRILRNLHFRSPLAELSYVAILELPDKYFHIRWRKQLHITPYIFGGIAGFYFNPQARYEGEWIALQPLGTEGQYIDGGNYPEPYQLFQFSVPGGMGLSVRFTKYLGVYIEMAYRRTITDYLDDVSSVYPDLTELEAASGPLAVALSNQNTNVFDPGERRGNPSSNDSYSFLQFGLSYYLRGRR